MKNTKFRAWDKKENKWVDYPIYIDGEGNIYWENYERGLQEDNDLIVMQSTGLVDKHGIQIFEGDIVILRWSDEVGESHWGKVTIKNPFEYTPEEARYFIYSDEIEVIGDIYENSDLI